METNKPTIKYPTHEISDEICRGCQMCDDWRYYSQYISDEDSDTKLFSTISNISDDWGISIITSCDTVHDVGIHYGKVEDDQYLTSEVFATWTKVHQM